MSNIISIREVFNNDNTLRGHTISLDDTDLINVSVESECPFETYVAVLCFLRHNNAFDGVIAALETIRGTGQTLTNADGMLVSSVVAALPEFEVKLALFPEHPELFEVMALDSSNNVFSMGNDSMFRILMTWASATENDSFDLVEELKAL
ncbi:MAG: hypothetical protein ACRCZ2_02825 [Fusobacteriaceae bacterium]